MASNKEPAPDAVVSSPHASSDGPVAPINPRDVAVVHGRDTEATKAIYAFLRSLDLRPREWEDLLGRAESATPHVGDLLNKLFENVQAVVVLFTPDDEARLHPDLQSPDEAQHETRFMGQARPNVLFEAGMAFGLYPHRTILVEAGDLRPISDLVGRHTVRPDSQPAIQGFVNRLRAAGCAVNSGGSDWLDLARFQDLPAWDRRPAARLQVFDKPPRLLATNIWLNPWTVGSREDIDQIASEEMQSHPVIARTLQRDLSRSAENWSLYSKKEGPNAPVRLKGQVNMQGSGPSDLRLLLVQQRFAVAGRLVSPPPDAGPFGFQLVSGQEINANFEVAIPDRKYGEGELLYALHVLYEDESGAKRELEIFWWYDFEEDKFWNNLNKVETFESIRENLW